MSAFGTPPPGPAAPLDRRCPACGSDDTASLRAIHEHGTSRSSGVVAGLVGDQFGLGGTAGVSMSTAAERAAPPARGQAGRALMLSAP